MARRLISTLFAVAALGAALAASSLARADDRACTGEDSIGKACTTAGPGGNLSGICETVSCESLDGGNAASGNDGGTCLSCVLDQTATGCGGTRTSAFAGSFTPTGGCCSVAGASPWESGAGLLLSSVFLGAALVARRRRARAKS